MTGGSTTTINLGTGLVVGNATIGDILSLPAIPGMSWSAPSGIAGVPAAFLENKTETVPTGSSVSFAYYSTEEITYGGYGTEPSFTPVFPRSNPTTALINGSLYWYGSHSGTQTPLIKYDGHVWYGAGLPRVLFQFGQPLIVAGAQTITDAKGKRSYTNVVAAGLNIQDIFARLSYKDKCGAIHDGDFSKQSGSLTATLGTAALYLNSPTAAPDYSVTIENARLATSASAQALVTTISVDNPHTLKIGDIAYFWNEVAAKFVEREIIGIAANSITISQNVITDGDVYGAVTVNEDAPISNNFRVKYYKSSEVTSNSVEFSQTQYTMLAGDLIAEVPFPANIYYTGIDFTKAEYAVSINESYRFDGATQYAPPLGKYVTSTNNGSSLLISGNIESDNTVYSSLPFDAEAFYIGRNAFTLDGTVTGLGSSGATTFVATNKQTYAVQGDIPNLNFRVEKITENLGVIAPASVCEIDEGAIHFNTIKGPFMLLGGRELKPVGEWPLDNRISAIEPYFTYNYTPRNSLVYQPSFEVASAYVIKEKKLIILNIPWNASTTFSYLYTGTLVYDYSMGGWFTWSGIDATCGAVYWDDKVWLAGQGATGTINLVSMQTPTLATNYHDHGTPITATVRYHWENGGDINSYKKFLWLTVYSPPGNGSNYNYNVKTYVNYETASSNSWKVPTAQHTSFTATATPPAYTVEAKLKSGKFASIMVEISNATSQEGMWISGTELDIAPTYRIPSRPGRKDT
jgi:hypothetical protein